MRPILLGERFVYPTNFKAPSKENGRGTCELNKHSTINTGSELHEQQGAILFNVSEGKMNINRRSKILGKFVRIFRKFSNKRQLNDGNIYLHFKAAYAYLQMKTNLTTT